MNMRTWLTARETKDLLGVSAARVMQLKSAGELVCDYDINGHCQFARESVDRCLSERTIRKASSNADGERRASENADIRAKAKREREREAKRLLDLAEEKVAREKVIVKYLGRIAKALERS